MQAERPPVQNPLPAQLRALREAAKVSISALAERTQLSRLTVAAAEGRSDARLSTVTALLDALGYTLVPVPKPLAGEVVAFINNGGRQLSVPAGATAPMGLAQRSFLAGGEEGSEP